MKTLQAGSGLQHVYKTEEELREAAARLGYTPIAGHNTLYFHEGTQPKTVHLYSKNNEKI
jgi:hypothetical protein